MKDRLLERRSTLIEELIKSDHTYRPPADYRPAKKHRKVRHRWQVVSPVSSRHAGRMLSFCQFLTVRTDCM
jgi:hypothetical protein